MNEVTKECRLCQSAGPHRTLAVREMMFGTRERFEYFLCAACQTLQIVHVLEAEELARQYPQNYYSYNTARPTVLQWLIRQQDLYKLHAGGRMVGGLLSRRLPDGLFRVELGGDVVRMLGQLRVARSARILDVGCGDGALLDRLAAVGFSNVSGVDPFLGADAATPLGVQLWKRDVGEVAGEFDLIMFNHSLEHVPDPVATLTVAGEMLAAGGACLVRVPTTSSEAWRCYGADWVQIDAPRHFVIPSRQAMALAAERAGLRVEQTFDDSSLAQFLLSEAYRRGVAMTDPKGLRMFGPRQIWEWARRADRLNRQGRGDQAGFVLRHRTS